MKNEIIVPLTGKEVNHAPAAKTYNLQIITAALMSIGGLALLFFGTCIEPQGEIHESLLIGFGEVATFAGALFGIDAAYSKKLWDITNLFAKHQTGKPSEEHSIASNTDTLEAPESTKSTSQK